MKKVPHNSRNKKNLMRWGAAKGMGAFRAARFRKRPQKQQAAPAGQTGKDVDIESQKQTVCPLDGRPCSPSCKVRYTDQAEGGCLLSTAAGQGATIEPLDGDNAAIIFLPADEQA